MVTSSLLLLIDGYNVVSPAAAPARGGPDWLHRERMRLVKRLVQHLDVETRHRTCVVFDAANPPKDRASQFTIDGILIWFAVGYEAADDLIEELISSHSAPKRLAVVSSDHRIQAAAGRRGCGRFDAAPWLDDLLEGRARLAIAPEAGAGQGGRTSTEKPDSISDQDAQRWLEEFGLD